MHLFMAKASKSSCSCMSMHLCMSESNCIYQCIHPWSTLHFQSVCARGVYACKGFYVQYTYRLHTKSMSDIVYTQDVHCTSKVNVHVVSMCAKGYHVQCTYRI